MCRRGRGRKHGVCRHAGLAAHRGSTGSRPTPGSAALSGGTSTTSWSPSGRPPTRRCGWSPGPTGWRSGSRRSATRGGRRSTRRTARPGARSGLARGRARGEGARAPGRATPRSRPWSASRRSSSRWCSRCCSPGFTLPHLQLDLDLPSLPATRPAVAAAAGPPGPVTLPEQVRWVLENSKYVWPVVLAFVLARAEIRRRRRQDEKRGS